MKLDIKNSYFKLILYGIGIRNNYFDIDIVWNWYLKQLFLNWLCMECVLSPHPTNEVHQHRNYINNNIILMKRWWIWRLWNLLKI